MRIQALLSRSVLLIIAISMASPSAYADPWFEYYQDAEKALENQDWSEAIQKLNLALESRGDSSVRARTYGMNFTSYFPYLKLGIAYYHLGQLDTALQAFDTEERLGVITQSETHLAELGRFRSLIGAAKERAAARDRQRIQTIVEESLAEATRFEQKGDFDAAMRVLGRALAVAPEHERAQAMMKRLRDAAAETQAERELEKQVASLTASGRALLTSGSYEEAYSSFERAWSLKPTPGLRRLRDEAQAKLRAHIEAVEDADRRNSTISQTLKAVASLEASGHYTQALFQLQSVLALEPDHTAALALQSRLRRAQAQADKAKAKSEMISSLESEVVARFNGKAYDEALSAANRLLALDADNSLARKYLADSYRQINRTLLGRRERENFPPAIRFADFRQAHLADGFQIEEVSDPHFKLSGTVINDQPVDLLFELAFSRTSREEKLINKAYRPIEGRSRRQPLGDLVIEDFNVMRDLDPGLSIFRIVAKDREGLSSSSEYAVLYAAPLHRAVWFRVTLAAAVLGLGAVVFVQRRLRRKRLLTRRFNPYVAGPPVFDPKLFFGREDLIARILQTVHNNSLLLFGERRIGKTSLQHHLKTRLKDIQDPDYAFYPAYIDLQGTTQARFFSTLAHELFEELAPCLDGLQPSPALSEAAAYTNRDFVGDLRRILKVLKERTSKKVKLVLLIDEVDELNAYDPKINQKLRSLFMKSFAENLVAVVSGVGIKKHWDSEGSPWYNFFEEIEIKPFSRAQAVQLITQPIKGVFKLESGVTDRIIELTDCRPYLIQKLCIAVVDRLHREGRRTISVADVESIGRPEEG